MLKEKHKDILLYLGISIVIITIFSESSYLYKLNPWSDLNIYLTIGRDILSGGKLYTTLFDHKGPILYFLYTLVSLLCKHSYFGVYLLEVICLFLFLYYSHKILRLFSEKSHPLFLTCIAIIITTSYTFSYGGGSVEELFLPIFQITNYICLSKMIKHESFDYKECILIGILACSSFLTKFTLCGYFLGVAICLIIYQYKIDKSKLFSCVLYTLLSFILIFGLTCIYFVVNHNMNDFIESYFKFNLFSYMAPRTFLERIKAMLSVVLLWYSKYNLILVPISTMSLVYSLIHFRKSYTGLFILTTSICWYFVTFVGAKYIAYYILPISIYSIYLILFLEKYKYANIFMILISFVSIFNSNNIKDIARKDYVQYEFSNIIHDSSFLVYKGYDQGFYKTSNQTPGCRYFTTTNGWLPNYEEDTLSCINSNEIEYLITMDNELNLDNYKLIKEVTYEYDTKDRTYRLYQRI